MPKRLVFGWFCLGLVALLGGCGSEARRGLSNEEWATIGAYQQQVSSLQTQVAAVVTAAPPADQGTPEVPFAQAWRVEIKGIKRVRSTPNYSKQSGAPLTLNAHGVFLELRLAVVNVGREPLDSFPRWRVRLQDATGRTFTIDYEATKSYVSSDISIERSAAYQPGLVYTDGIVFDIPPDAPGLMLVSKDGTVKVPIPASGPLGTPSLQPPIASPQASPIAASKA